MKRAKYGTLEVLQKFQITFWPPSFASDYYWWQFHSGIQWHFVLVKYSSRPVLSGVYIETVWNGEKSKAIYRYFFTCLNRKLLSETCGVSLNEALLPFWRKCWKDLTEACVNFLKWRQEKVSNSTLLCYHGQSHILQ